MDSPVVLRSLEMGLANEDAHDELLLQAELGDTDPEYVLRVDLHRVNVGEVSQYLGVTQPRDTGRMIEFAIAAVDANPLSTAFWVRDTLRTFKFTGAGLWFTTPPRQRYTPASVSRQQGCHSKTCVQLRAAGTGNTSRRTASSTAHHLATLRRFEKRRDRMHTGTAGRRR